VREGGINSFKNNGKTESRKKKAAQPFTSDTIV